MKPRIFYAKYIHTNICMCMCIAKITHIYFEIIMCSCKERVYRTYREVLLKSKTLKEERK